jgi:hypothetical protein
MLSADDGIGVGIVMEARRGAGVLSEGASKTGLTPPGRVGDGIGPPPFSLSTSSMGLPKTSVCPWTIANHAIRRNKNCCNFISDFLKNTKETTVLGNQPKFVRNMLNLPVRQIGNLK